jgi:A/G-specific adenine glycosylase
LREILDWYDQNARELPWRVSPSSSKSGVRPDPYHVWLSEIMLQQTTVQAVIPYFLKFRSTWPTVSDLAAAEDADVMAAWAGLGYYSRARNLLKTARVVAEEREGLFPSDETSLLKLPGIGPYTAAAIAAIAFGNRAAVMDGNIERVVARLFSVTEPLPGAKSVLKAHVEAITPHERVGDYVQAKMDLGATICTPRNPACGICPLLDLCEGRKNGLAPELPRKEPKKAKPTRFGFAYLARRDDGAWLLERRPPMGLLGGMLGLPGSEWSDKPSENPPCDANWQRVAAEVRHTFTHFHLRLTVNVANVPLETEVRAGSFLGRHSVSAEDLPTVMRKAFVLGRDALGSN